MDSTQLAIVALAVGAVIGGGLAALVLLALRTRDRARVEASLELPDGTRQEIFGAGGGATVAESLTQSIGAPVELLGQIPLDTTLREGADHGIPVVVGHPDAPAAVALRGIAKGLGTRARGLAGRSLGLTPSTKL